MRPTLTEHAVACPNCGSAMVLRTTTKYRYPNGSPRLFYGCPSFPACDGVHGAHPDGRPAGIPGDASTKAARIRAHAAFDTLWKNGGLSRREAYAVIGEYMGLGRKECHIAMLDSSQCERLILAVEEFYSAISAIGGQP
jgi:ssDNA-binding Zn-finger/Zn-ribbon topoisomerase 1